MPPIERLLKVEDVAKLTGLSPRTIFRMIGDGRMPDPVRINQRAVRFRASEIDQWLRLGCPNRADFLLHHDRVSGAGTGGKNE